MMELLSHDRNNEHSVEPAVSSVDMTRQSTESRLPSVGNVKIVIRGDGLPLSGYLPSGLCTADSTAMTLCLTKVRA